MNIRLDIHSRGFTLIELLVVIAIIGMLSSVVLASLNSARGKARDARRVADVKQMMLALELYRDDNNGACPDTGWQSSNDASGNTSGGNSWAITQAAMSSYIPSLPHDPKEGTATATTGGYAYSIHCWSTGEYMIVFNIENAATRTKLEASDGYTYSGGSFFDYGTAIVWGTR